MSQPEIKVVRVVPLIGKIRAATFEMNDDSYLALFFTLQIKQTNEEADPVEYHIVQQIYEDYDGYINAIIEDDVNAEQRLAEWLFQDTGIGAQPKTLYQVIAMAISEYLRHLKDCKGPEHSVTTTLPLAESPVVPAAT